MIYVQADLVMADRHIAEGEAHIMNQKTIITRLRAHGASTELAERLLEAFRATLEQQAGSIGKR